MREWTGFTSYSPRDMGESIDRYFREISASIKRIKRGQQPTGSGASLILATMPPAESAMTEDGVIATPVVRVARVEHLGATTTTTGTLTTQSAPGMYRLSFVAYATAIPTTSALTISAVFNDALDLAYAASGLSMSLGPYVSGSCTFYNTDSADISYEITFTNSMTANYWLVLEAL